MTASAAVGLDLWSKLHKRGRTRRIVSVRLLHRLNVVIKRDVNHRRRSLRTSVREVETIRASSYHVGNVANPCNGWLTIRIAPGLHPRRPSHGISSKKCRETRVQRVEIVVVAAQPFSVSPFFVVVVDEAAPIQNLDAFDM